MLLLELAWSLSYPGGTSLFSHTHNHQSCVSPLPSLSLSLYFSLVSFFPSSFPLSRVLTSLINRRDPFLSFGLWAVVLLLPFLPSFTLLDSCTGSFRHSPEERLPTRIPGGNSSSTFTPPSQPLIHGIFFPCSNF
ncbi:hypothetical protein BDV30DRAFT_157676 [Aspergillus minisclerotigenes]|uniref:Uncharacterized protein n=1 Tax=Aspergillus minisclerotigenes TaxID=656917 RepID=A0A5N6IY56_9EURO|nr:hypothetical protein BDV30DRAFT_157676 [Aspergillus minisclerotigenes]